MAESASPAQESLRPIANVEAMGRSRRYLSAEIVIGAVKIADFVTIVGSGLLLRLLVRNPAAFNQYLVAAGLGAILFLIGCNGGDSYRFGRLANFWWQVWRVAAVWVAVMGLLSMLAFLMQLSTAYSRQWGTTWALVAFSAICLERVVLSSAITHWSRQRRLARNVVVVGGGAIGQRLIARLNESEEPVNIVGVFDDRRDRIPSSVGGCPVLGAIDDLVTFAREFPVTEVILALPLDAVDRLRDIIDRLKLLPVDLRVSMDEMASAFPVRGISYFGGVPALVVMERPIKHWNAVVKWLEDKLLSLTLLLLFAPLMAIIAAVIKFESRGPVFFVQDRFGFNNNIIRVLKFRTMFADRCDPSGQQRTVRNDPRVTRFGRLLRNLSLDELPQLFNVIRGDMSIVGPRAHAIHMKAGDRLYHEAVIEYSQRHRVKPGITGWAQIHGLRGEIDSLDKAMKRVSYDLYYIDHWSVWMDIKVILLSFRVLVSRENAY